MILWCKIQRKFQQLTPRKPPNKTFVPFQVQISVFPHLVSVYHNFAIIFCNSRRNLIDPMPYLSSLVVFRYMVTNMHRFLWQYTRLCMTHSGKFKGPVKNSWIRLLDPQISRGQYEIKIIIQFSVSHDIVLCS